MFDYSVFDKLDSKPFKSSYTIKFQTNENYKNESSTTFENYIEEKVQVVIKIRLYKKHCKTIYVNKDESLEDLHVKIYNAVYPKLSTGSTLDVIPPPSGLIKIPRLYYTSVFNSEEDFIFLPVHKFISLDSFMKANPTYFKSISYFGPPMYNIYVADEEGLEKINNRSTNPPNPYYQKFVSCMG